MDGNSFAQNERIARDMENRRGRRVGGGAAGSVPFESGVATCTRCGTEEDAGRMIRTGHGVICESCDLQLEAPPLPTGNLWFAAGGALAAGILSVGLLAHALILVAGGYDEVMGTIANIEAILGAGVGVVSFVVGLPIWRRRNQPEDLTGQSALWTQWMSLMASLGMVLGAIGGILLIVFGALGAL